MTAIDVDPATTTPGYQSVSSAGVSATASPANTWTLMIEPAPAWLSEVETRLNELLALEENWDTYGALPLEPSHALTAVQLLQYLAPPDAPAPWIVPTTRRGVQLEWHLGDVEIEVRADDSGTQIYVADEAGEDEGDLVRRSDLCGRAALAIAMMTASA